MNAYDFDAEAFAKPPLERADAFDVVGDALDEEGLHAEAATRRSWAQTMRECLVVDWRGIPEAAYEYWREFGSYSPLPRLHLRLEIAGAGVATYDLDQRGECFPDVTGTVVSAELVDTGGLCVPITLDSPRICSGTSITVSNIIVTAKPRAWRVTIAQLREVGLDMRDQYAIAAALDTIGAEALA